MATANYWAEPKVVREQIVLFAPSLDSMISDDHEVRLLDETLRSLDWSEWEAEYSRLRGQPPIHPRVLAGLWLYAMMRRIRTSRPLEYACGHNIDFIWLGEGLVPDHATLAEFFSKHPQPLKTLFKQVCKVAMTMGLIRLGVVAFDGTRVKASNSRYRTLTAKSLDERLVDVEAQIEQIMTDVRDAEAAAAQLGGGENATKLPSELAGMQARRTKLQEALEIAKALDETRGASGVDTAKNPAQVPMTDLESRVMPNKEGGFAPNYTPTCLTDGANGFILDAAVIALVNEHPEALPAVDRATEMCGEKPENFLADGGMATGPILAGLETREITSFVPAEPSTPSLDNPARRDDATQPVPEALWPKLPLSPRGQLDKSCFVYVAERDEYLCPMGRVLKYDSRETRAGVELYRYQSVSCADCPLAARCLSSRTKSSSPANADEPPGRRTLRRDEHTETRDRVAARMATPEAQALFDRRSSIAETPFGYLKGVLGLRQFRHRGLEKVDQEWRWSCLSLNFKKLVRALRRWRQEFAAAMALELA